MVIIRCRKVSAVNMSGTPVSPGKSMFLLFLWRSASYTANEQEETGFAKEYLGMYEYYDAYVSEQGYRVILLEENRRVSSEQCHEKRRLFLWRMAYVMNCQDGLLLKI